MRLFKGYRFNFLLWFFLFLFNFTLFSQENHDQIKKLPVYLTGFPDLKYLNDKIEFSQFVDLKDLASVVVKIEEKSLASAEIEFIISFSGQKELNGITDRLTYIKPTEEIEQDTKKNLATTIEMGLIKYAARTPIRENISIKYSHTEEQVGAVKDKWNYWLFSLSFHFNLNRERSMEGNSLSGGISARRITDEWIIRASAHTHYDENIFDLEDIGLSYKNITRNHNFHGLLVNSINDHWSIGAFTEASQATYYNNKFSFELAPAVEYNVFPYIESEKRSFTFLYRLGYVYRKYWEETIFEKLNEGLLQISLMTDVEIIKDWGSIESSLTGSVYLDNFDKNRLTWDFQINMRVFKRLSFDIEFGVEMIHDQIFLGSGGASLEEVLLRRKRLETRYDYSVEFGFSYSFGSLNNNITNPIFGN